ncbi:hypothetical protein FSARC_13976 [Fusarium sarcochroum]|uniref:SnoaL-like domain-containing protein n=1 Tax=Fusarium sarcochroum TaxID=1208366 RepID=A0A8H4SX91_9HYPO|nr:hypothetical protein FSARC_13976 [Fusarium sarcochroum]
MASGQDLRKHIEKTTRSFMNAYKDVGEKNDPTIINRDVTEDCKRHFLPASAVEFLGMPPGYTCDNAAYEAAMARDIKRGIVKRIVISNLTIDTEARKSAVTSISDMVFKDGETVAMEHSWVFDFNEDGSKITNVIEFCDLGSLRKMVGKVYPDGFEP